MPKLKPQVKAARLFLIVLFAFGLWQIPFSVWLDLWNWAMETGKLIVLGK